MANSEYILSNRLAWVGLLGAFLFGAIEYFGSPNSTGLTFQIAQSFLLVVTILHLASIGLIIYGCAGVLRSKSRSLLWLFLLAPAFVAPIGPIMIVFIFALGDNSSPPSGLREAPRASDG